MKRDRAAWSVSPRGLISTFVDCTRLRESTRFPTWFNFYFCRSVVQKGFTAFSHEVYTFTLGMSLRGSLALLGRRAAHALLWHRETRVLLLWGKTRTSARKGYEAETAPVFCRGIRYSFFSKTRCKIIISFFVATFILTKEKSLPLRWGRWRSSGRRRPALILCSATLEHAQGVPI